MYLNFTHTSESESLALLVLDCEAAVQKNVLFFSVRFVVLKDYESAILFKSILKYQVSHFTFILFKWTDEVTGEGYSVGIFNSNKRCWAMLPSSGQ